MKRFAVATIALAALTGTSIAQEPDSTAPQTLGACLIENHDPSLEVPMKAFLVAVLQDDKATAQTQVLGFGTSIAQAAISKCGVTLNEMQGPNFEREVEIYGAWIGEKVMTDAMSGMGLM